jgi:hypothetical protein
MNWPFVWRSKYDALRIRLIGKQEAYDELGAHVEFLRRELNKHKMLVASFNEAAGAEAGRALERAARRGRT